MVPPPPSPFPASMSKFPSGGSKNIEKNTFYEKIYDFMNRKIEKCIEMITSCSICILCGETDNDDHDPSEHESFNRPHADTRTRSKSIKRTIVNK